MVKAVIFPLADFDATLHPEVLRLFGLPSFGAVTSSEEAKHWLNFGTLELGRSSSTEAAS